METITKSQIKNQFQSTATIGDQKLEARLAVIFFEDDGSTIAYCPALDVYGYGQDEQSAKESFETCIEEFFLYTIEKAELQEYLQKLGWKTTSKTNNTMTPPTMNNLLQSNNTFCQIFNTRDFRKSNASVHIPAFA